MVDQLVETWRINNRVNLFLLDNIGDNALNASFRTENRGTPITQFAHIYNVRFWKLEELASKLIEGESEITTNDQLDRAFVRQKLIETEEIVAEVLRKGFENEGIIEGFRRGAAVLMGYFISHESHHRGNIMLTMKKCGFDIPKSVEYGIWNWNSI